MKRWKVIIRIILTLFFLVSIATYFASAAVRAEQKRVPTLDSLNVLDSLVNNTKVSNTALSIKYAKHALAFARHLNSDSALALSYELLGIAYLQSHKDSSYYYLIKALQIADSANLVKLKIPVINNLAYIYLTAYNFEDAIKLLDLSIRLADSTNDFAGLSRAYNMLGNIKYSTHDIDNARKLYQSALLVAKDHSLYLHMGAALSNLAKNEFEPNKRKSIALQKEALGYLEKVKYGNEEEIAYLLINMCYRYTKDSALFYYKNALKVAVNAKLIKLLFGAYNGMAYSYLEKGDIQMAESCLKDHAIPVAIKENDHDWLSSLYDTYADVCVAQQNYKQAFELQRKALKERVMDNKQKASEQVRLLATLLDVKNKELTIQNEDKELLIQRNRLQKTELLLSITLLLVVGSVFVTFVLQQRNRVKLHKEQVGSARRIIEMEENEKGRTARELHDLTGQLVLGISGTIENIDFPDPEIKDQIKDRIGELGKSMRQISHRMNRAMIEHFTFSELITGLCEDVQKLTGLAVSIEIPEEFPDLPKELVLHFYRIMQELMTNAGKYASESQVKIRIKAGRGKLTLFYSDNGPGFIPEEKRKSSMGIMNIFERTKLINGHAIVKSSPGKGTTWEIVFPFAQLGVNS